MSFAPLVEPAEELTIDEVRRYSRHLIIPDVGMAGQKRLKNAKVLVIGAGGLGSPALLYLAAAGVGTLGIAEFDTVDESNLQRQVIHGVSDIDKPKGQSAKESVAEINPYVNVVLHEERLDNDNVLQVFEGYDLIVDGTDNFATRYMVNDAAYFLKIPYVWGSIYRFDGQASVFWPHAVDENGESADAPCYRCLYPEPPPPGMVPSCAEGGVLGVLCASIGSIQVNEAIKVLTGIGDPAVGKLVIYDALELEWRKLKVRKDPSCALCGENPTVTGLIDYETFCGAISEEAADAAAGSTISVIQVEHMLKEREEGARDFVLVDVREPNEYEINQIPGSVLIPKGDFLNGSALEQLPGVDSGKQVVMYCKTGVRSAETLAIVKGAGYSDAVHVGGGVSAWVNQVDPSQPYVTDPTASFEPQPRRRSLRSAELRRPSGREADRAARSLRSMQASRSERLVGQVMLARVGRVASVAGELSQPGQRLREDLGRGSDESGADLADAGDLAGHAGVDLRQDPGAAHLGDVDAGRRALELQDGHRPARVLAEGDLVHPAGGRQRVGHRAADEPDDRRRGRHREAADAGRLGDRRVADVRVGVVRPVVAEEQAVGELGRSGEPLVAGAGDLDAEVGAVAGHRHDHRRALDAAGRVERELARGHGEVEEEVVVAADEAQRLGDVRRVEPAA